MKGMRTTPALVALLAIGACTKPPDTAFDPLGEPTVDDAGDEGSVDGADAATVVDAGVGMFAASKDGGPDANGGCAFADSTDHDGDGFSFADGDCNDCDPNSNPGAFDVPKNGVDEDCDGIVDNEPAGCDANAVLDSNDPFNAALAIDICRKTTDAATKRARTWGVVGARFVAPDGTDECDDTYMMTASCAADPEFSLGHGNLTQLGVNSPHAGSHMLALSSGIARDPTDPGYAFGSNKGYTDNAAAGFPAAAPACPDVVTGPPHDGVALELTIRVPTNARSFSYEENFFSAEFPQFICSTFNDTFVVEMTPKPATLANGNIAFDAAGNPFSVNNSLLQVCTPQVAGGSSVNFACPLGPDSLSGTGFEGHAATGWLTTTVNVDPALRGKDITLLFAIWDSGDGNLDSETLVDNFRWSTEGGSTAPVTQPTPPPK